ncbi:putative protein S-acyltransferase 15 [Glycine max]|nr:putative protein S-acyltransferase 15 [Glycine max]
MKGKRFLSVPVLAVFLLMLFVYYSSIFVFLQDWLGLQSSPGTLNAFLFSLFASLSLFSFFSCVLTDPGHVPSSYAPDVEFSKDNAEQKKCDKCFAYKPPRTHHCRVCRRCILKMVGFLFDISFYNVQIIFMSCVFQKDWDPIKGSSLKIFYLGKRGLAEIVGVTVGSGVAEIDGCNTGKIARPWRLMVLVQRLCDRNPEVGAGPEGSIACLVAEVYREKPLGFVAHGKSRLVCCLCRYAFCSETNHSVLYGTMVVGLTITLLTLFGWHVYLILHNMTTIEYYEGNRAKWLAMRSGQSYRHPFNIGAYKNITLVLGPNMLKWLCPTAVSHLKDGVSFPTLRDNS